MIYKKENLYDLNHKSSQRYTKVAGHKCQKCQFQEMSNNFVYTVWPDFQ